MNTQHSPGPWIADGGLVIDNKGRIITEALEIYYSEIELSDGTFGVDSGMMPWESNAKLIAAAPELLDALRELYEAALVMECIPLYKGLKKAQTLISKLTDQ